MEKLMTSKMNWRAFSPSSKTHKRAAAEGDMTHMSEGVKTWVK